MANASGSRFNGWFYRNPRLLRGSAHDPPVQRDRESLRRINPLIHKLAWDEYAAQGFGEQSAERIAERGGFSEHELLMLLADGLMRAKDYVSTPNQVGEAVCFIKDCDSPGTRRVKIDIGPTLGDCIVRDEDRKHTVWVCDQHHVAMSI